MVTVSFNEHHASETLEVLVRDVKHPERDTRFNPRA